MRGIPVGTAIVADQKTQQRSFLIKLRPRLSYHAGSSAMPKAFQDKKRTKKRAVPLTGAYIPKIMPSVLEPTPLPRQHGEFEEEIEEEMVVEAPEEVMKTSPSLGTEDRTGDILEEIPEEPLPDLPWGTTILLKDRSREDLEMFVGNIEGARSFILFSPTDPSTYILPMGPERIDRWMTSKPAKGSILLSDMDGVVKEFEERGGPPGARVIIIDGFDDLLNNNPSEKVRKMMGYLRGKVFEAKDLLVVRAGGSVEGALLDGIFSDMVIPDEKKGEIPVLDLTGLDSSGKFSVNGSLSIDELKWMCSVMGLPVNGSENELLNRLLEAEPELAGAVGDDISRIDILKQIVEESSRAKEENERLRSRIDDLESAAGLDVQETSGESSQGPKGHSLSDKRLVLVWEDEEEQKDKVEDLILEVEDLRDEMDDEYLERPSERIEDTIFSRMISRLDEERHEYRDRLDRLEDILQSEMDSLKDEIGEQRKQIEASRKVMKLRVVKQRTPDTEIAQVNEKKVVKKKRVVKQGVEVAAVQPRLGSQTVLEIARRNLKRSLLRGPKESIDEIIPCYVQLYRFLVNYKGGFIKGIREADLFMDSMTGEIVEQGRTGLRRSDGMMNLLKTTDLEMDIIKVLGRSPKDPAWISKSSKTDITRVKRSLSSLEKKGLVKRSRKEANLDLYSLADDMNIPPRPWSKDHGFQVEFVKGIEERMVPVKVGLQDARSVVEKLSREVEIIDQDIVRYPVFVVKIRGEGRTRYIAVDGFGGRLDRRLSNLLKGVVETWD